MATIKRKYEFAGIGCLVQFIGIVLLFWWPIGTILGIILFLVGSAKSCKLICSECGHRIPDKNVKICENCKATFQKERHKWTNAQ